VQPRLIFIREVWRQQAIDVVGALVLNYGSVCTPHLVFVRLDLRHDHVVFVQAEPLLDYSLLVVGAGPEWARGARHVAIDHRPTQREVRPTHCLAGGVDYLFGRMSRRFPF